MALGLTWLMNYETNREALAQTLRRTVLFSIEREAHRHGFVGTGEALHHPELGLRLSIRCTGSEQET